MNYFTLTLPIIRSSSDGERQLRRSAHPGAHLWFLAATGKRRDLAPTYTRHVASARQGQADPGHPADA